MQVINWNLHPNLHRHAVLSLVVQPLGLVKATAAHRSAEGDFRKLNGVPVPGRDEAETIISIRQSLWVPVRALDDRNP